MNAVDAKSGMSVLQCLKEKHSELSQIDETLFRLVTYCHLLILKLTHHITF